MKNGGFCDVSIVMYHKSHFVGVLDTYNYAPQPVEHNCLGVDFEEGGKLEDPEQNPEVKLRWTQTQHTYDHRVWKHL